MSYSSDGTYSLTTASTTAEIVYGGVHYAVIFVPTGSSITSLTFHAAPKSGGTFLPLYDTFGDAVVLTVAAGKAYPVPSACQGVGAIKMVGDAAGDVKVSFQG